MVDFSAMSLTELKEEAKKRGLKGVSAMRKTELIDMLSAQDKAKEPETEVKAAEMPAVEAKAEPEEERVQEELRPSMQSV